MKNKLDWFDDNWNWDVRHFQGVHVVEALWIYHMNCGSVSSHCCSKLCIPLRGEQQATHENVAKMQRS